MPDAQTRHTRGLTVVVILGVIFFALLALLILRSGKHGDAPPPASENLSVLALRLRLRTQPTANAPVVATATNGEKLIVLEDRGAWVRVQDDDGMTGWAERNSLERTSERERRLARYETIRKLPALNAIVSARTPLYAGTGAPGGSGPWAAASARARSRSAEILTTADVSGAARIRPTVPKSAPPAIVTTSTASGWMPRAAPMARGCTSCWRIPLASSSTTIIPAAASDPAEPSAIRTANMAALQAPM
jgi:hypothetical protein